MTKCKICDRGTAFVGNARVLGKYQSEYRYCLNCGFIFPVNPDWLSDAYSKSITDSDTGLVQRNIYYSKITHTFLKFFIGSKGKCVDFGGGYGLFVRLMRDKNCDFYWCDKYSSNLFALGYEAVSGTKYDLLTAFEVFEHLNDPRQELENMLVLSNSILFSTELVPDPRPALDKWWYFGLEHGQHISLYTKKSLEILAEQYRLNFITKGTQLHLFSKQKITPFMFRVSTSNKIARLYSIFY